MNDFFAFDDASLRRIGDGAAAYASARPFPHAVIDDFFPRDVAARLLAEYPPVETFSAVAPEPGAGLREQKFQSTARTPISPFTRQVLNYLLSRHFIAAVETLTGIAGMVGDPDVDTTLRHFRGGGELGVHVDGSWNPAIRLDRRVNVLVYMNEEWRPEWGGGLELWEGEKGPCSVRIEPLFNRCVVFTTTDHTWHGFSKLTLPEGVTRKSIQLYYFTNGRPAGEAASRHGTIFAGAAASAPAPTSRLRKAVADWVPPILLRAVRRLRW